MGDILNQRDFPTEAAARYREAHNLYTAVGDESAAQQLADKLKEIKHE